MTEILSSTYSLGASETDRAAARQESLRQLQRMSATMVAEEGLLNHAQAALILDVSTKRIGELVRLKKLTRFDFLGRTYVSMKEIRARCQQELKTGRPRRSAVSRIGASLKAAAKTDKLQMRLGGYAGPYGNAKHQEAKRKQKGKLRRIWREPKAKRRENESGIA